MEFLLNFVVVEEVFDYSKKLSFYVCHIATDEVAGKGHARIWVYMYMGMLWNPGHMYNDYVCSLSIITRFPQWSTAFMRISAINTTSVCTHVPVQHTQLPSRAIVSSTSHRLCYRTHTLIRHRWLVTDSDEHTITEYPDPDPDSDPDHDPDPDCDYNPDPWPWPWPWPRPRPWPRPWSRPSSDTDPCLLPWFGIVLSTVFCIIQIASDVLHGIRVNWRRSLVIRLW